MRKSAYLHLKIQGKDDLIFHHVYIHKKCCLPYEIFLFFDFWYLSISNLNLDNVWARGEIDREMDVSLLNPPLTMWKRGHIHTV